MEISAATRRNWAVPIVAIVLLGIVLRWLLFSPLDISYADELMQYLEQGNRLATGHGIIPWEYRYDARNAPLPQLLALPLWLGHWLAPGTLTAMLLARVSFMALCFAGLPAAWRLGALTSSRHALVALFVAACWYESVLFGELLLSECLATVLLLLGAAPLLAAEPSRRALRFAGLMLGLGVLVRLQYAGFAGVLALAALRLDLRRWTQLLIGGAAAMLVGAVSDMTMGQVPFGWILVNFAMNIGSGRAARFGAEGPLEYIRMLLVHLGPAAPLILAGAVLAGDRYRPLVLATLANLLIHSLITHKEYRFIWLSVFTILILAAIASVRLADHLAARRNGGQPASLAWLIALCIGWLGLSLAAQAESGGARTMRGGGAIPRMALVAAAQSSTCGIALPDQWRAHLVPALLPRPIPLYVAPKQVVAQNAPLPADLVQAANALVLPALPPGTSGYRQIACQKMPIRQACVFVRAGTCTPSATWTYQKALEREDL